MIANPNTIALTEPEVLPTSPEPPELFIEHATLYHGSATANIDRFNLAVEDTVGSGVYLVDNPGDATGYAKRRARSRNTSPVVYEVEVASLRLANLANSEKLAEVMKGFAEALQHKKDSLPPDAFWLRSASIDHALDAIHTGIKVGHVKEATHGSGKLFSGFMQSQGYDGIKTPEGGEGQDVGPHDTYLIFDPTKVVSVKAGEV